MAITHLSLHPSSWTGEQNNMTNDNNNGNPEGRVSTSGDSNCNISPLTSPKRTSRFRLSSLKQLGAVTRNEIRANVRNDWDWPLPEDGDGKPLDLLNRVNPDTEFVERSPGSDESEDLDEDDNLGRAQPADGTTRLLNGGFGGKKRGSVGRGFPSDGSHQVLQNGSVDTRAAARKEKRRKRLREELEWNDGLRMFEARRNAWTGSVLKAPYESSEAKTLTNGVNGHVTLGQQEDHATADKDRDDDSSSTAQKIPNGIPNGIPEGMSNGAQGDGHNGNVTFTKSSPNTIATNGHCGQERQGDDGPNKPAKETGGARCNGLSSDNLDLIPYIPISPPLVSPEHPVRREITSSTYLQIYSRVVVQGTTPNLPINLTDMINVLVTGWKADDQWPPKPAGPLEPLAGRRKNKSKGGAASVLLPSSKTHETGTNGRSERGLVHGLKKVLRITNSKEDKASSNAAALLGL